MAHSWVCLSRSMEYRQPGFFVARGAHLEHQTQKMFSIFMTLMSRDAWVSEHVKDAARTLLNLNSRSFNET
jgi:hypothetical protein